MPLPNNFSPAEHLQDTIRRVVNREVKEWFSDVGPDNWDPDIGSARGSLRIACTHQEADTMDMTLQRMYLFDFVVRQRFNQPIYGLPVSSFQEERRFKPQIMLFFQEDVQDVDPDFSPCTGEISFRLMSHTSETITPAIATTYANRIRANFTRSGGFNWRKGKYMCSYTDRRKGYQLQLLCRDKNEGRRVVEQVLDVQQHTPDWRFMNVSENEAQSQAYPITPPRERVYGEIRRLPRRRPIADVRFQYAVMNIWGLQNPVCLVDRSGAWSNPLAA